METNNRMKKKLYKVFLKSEMSSEVSNKTFGLFRNVKIVFDSDVLTFFQITHCPEMVKF